MHYLVIGANGFVGRHIVAELLSAGHGVTAAARRPDVLTRLFPGIDALRLDLAALPADNDLIASLRGVEVVVNAAGLLDGKDLARVHADGPAAIYRAAAAAGVGRIILISAISARIGVDTGYSRTKLAGEAALRAGTVPWTILRPSLVVAKGSYGGTSVLRGLAGLPLVTPVMDLGDARFSPIHARDLAKAVIAVGADARFAGQTLEPAGPETLNLSQLVRAYRGWLGFRPAWELRIPRPFVRSAGRLGDLLGGGPISTASLDQLAAGNAGNGTAFAEEIGFAPRGIRAILAAEPADVQDRWHARLFFLAILTRATLIAIWLASAVAGLSFGYEMGAVFAAAAGLPGIMVWPLILLTFGIDLVAAAALLFDRRGHFAFWLQLLVVLGYTAGLTLFMPWLWADPFGPILKNLAVLVLIGINAALTDQR